MGQEISHIMLDIPAQGNLEPIEIGFPHRLKKKNTQIIFFLNSPLQTTKLLKIFHLASGIFGQSF